MANSPPLDHGMSVSTSSKSLLVPRPSLSTSAHSNTSGNENFINFDTTSQFTNYSNLNTAAALDDSMVAAASAADYLARSPTPIVAMSPNYDEDPFITSPMLLTTSLNNVLRTNYSIDKSNNKETVNGNPLSTFGSTSNSSISTMNSYVSNGSLRNYSSDFKSDNNDTQNSAQHCCGHKNLSQLQLTSTEPSLDDILADKAASPYNLASFMAYMSQQHCLETLEFILDTQKYHEYFMSTQYSKTHLKRLWKRITDTYINFNSSRELNLQADIKEALLKLTDTSLKNEDANAPSPNNFDPACGVVKIMIKENAYIGFLCSFKSNIPCECYKDSKSFTHATPTITSNLTTSLAMSFKSNISPKLSDNSNQEGISGIKSPNNIISSSVSTPSSHNENDNKKNALKRLQFESPEISYSDEMCSAENLCLQSLIPISYNAPQAPFGSMQVDIERPVISKNTEFSLSPLLDPSMKDIPSSDIDSSASHDDQNIYSLSLPVISNLQNLTKTTSHSPYYGSATSNPTSSQSSDSSYPSHWKRITKKMKWVKTKLEN